VVTVRRNLLLAFAQAALALAALAACDDELPPGTCPLDPGCRYGECDNLPGGPNGFETCDEDGPDAYESFCNDGKFSGGARCDSLVPRPDDAGVDAPPVDAPSPDAHTDAEVAP
jgi:hypothetical protein